jgi:hypothetical protein
VTAVHAPEISQLAFRGQWRRYQTLALRAFEADRPYAGAEQDTLVVLPRHPGMVRPATDTPPHYPLSQRGPFRLAGYAATPASFRPRAEAMTA